jgi:hypothetical protein
VALNVLRRLFVFVSTLIAAMALYLVKSLRQETIKGITSPGLSMLRTTRVHTTNSRVCLKSLVYMQFFGRPISVRPGEYRTNDDLRNPDVETSENPPVVCRSFSVP